MRESCPSCASEAYAVVNSVTSQKIVEGYAATTVQVDVQHLIPDSVQQFELHRCSRCDLQWFSPPIEGDAAFYEDLQANAWYYQEEKPEYAHAATLIAGLGPRPRVLEVGCGRGAFGTYLGASAAYRGLEFNLQAVSGGQAMGLDVAMRPVEEEAGEFPESYDAVCHFQVLEHVANLQSFMTSCMQALRPGGLLIVTVPSDDSFLALAPATWLNMPPHHITRWSDAALKNLLVALGLEQIQLWHEPVADEHRAWYRGTLARYAVFSTVGLPLPLDGSSRVLPLADNLYRVPGLGEMLFRMGERRFPFSHRGHSVTAWGRKAG